MSEEENTCLGWRSCEEKLSQYLHL